jgi:hypothetical protein
MGLRMRTTSASESAFCFRFASFGLGGHGSRAHRVEEVGILGEPVAVLHNALGVLLLAFVLGVPLRVHVVARRALQPTQDLLIVVHDAR